MQVQPNAVFTEQSGTGLSPHVHLLPPTPPTCVLLKHAPSSVGEQCVDNAQPPLLEVSLSASGGSSKNAARVMLLLFYKYMLALHSLGNL